MKRLLTTSLLCLLSLCLLCGCQPANSSGTLSNVKSATLFTASDGAVHFSVALTEQGGVFRFSEPEILRELTVTLTDNSVHACYDGLETDVPDTFLASILPFYEAILALQSEQAEQTNKKEPSWEITKDGNTYRLYEEAKDGIFARIDTETQNGSKSYLLYSCSKKED